MLVSKAIDFFSQAEPAKRTPEMWSTLGFASPEAYRMWLEANQPGQDQSLNTMPFETGDIGVPQPLPFEPYVDKESMMIQEGGVPRAVPNRAQMKPPFARGT